MGKQQSGKGIHVTHGGHRNHVSPRAPAAGSVTDLGPQGPRPQICHPISTGPPALWVLDVSGRAQMLHLPDPGGPELLGLLPWAPRLLLGLAQPTRTCTGTGTLRLRSAPSLPPGGHPYTAVSLPGIFQDKLPTRRTPSWPLLLGGPKLAPTLLGKM